MRKLFWGFLLIFLDFNLTLNQHALEVLPDFVGYLVIMKGLEELTPESPLFEKLRPAALVLAVLSGLQWLGALLNIHTGGVLLDLALLAGTLYLVWALIASLREAETFRGADLNSAGLQKLWLPMLVLQLSGCALRLLALLSFGLLAVLAIPLAIAGLVVSVLLLMALWRAAGLYEALPPRDSGVEPH